MNEDNSAADKAVIIAIIPAIANERITAGPATPAATPLRTKIPAPIIFAIPTEAAPKVPIFLFSSDKIIHQQLNVTCTI
jgi:hypothetical protein